MQMSRVFFTAHFSFFSLFSEVREQLKKVVLVAKADITNAVLSFELRTFTNRINYDENNYLLIDVDGIKMCSRSDRVFMRCIGSSNARNLENCCCPKFC